ncbi:aminoglycoside phosphotransferase family protein [Nonomuraea angiospora]|uniref:aminoglycoside phosphotransferase family protein n=1 Tax=Nonomuraea angiospora TaxID=46172 RepID=UPI0029A23736|nr:aminoglycoside phosphotransferase family protein [Nonomuraea angiospora]MDX3109883.1 aminoglycoside phosphotransferase family protein [Nonomuraea angiospora]
MAGMPPATGSQRITWAEVPAEVRAAIEKLLGSEVAAAASQPGGFSEGVAARLRLADGGRAFVKAASSLVAPGVARFHRREIEVSRRLPDGVPAPRLLHAHDDGTWVALVFEDVEGRLPAQPWERDELDRVLAAATGLARALTPSPIDPALLAPPRLGGWRALANEGGAGRLPPVSRWASDHLDELVALEEAAASSLTGETLLHGDLYPFNIMLTADRVLVVDWPHAWAGAPHCDVLTLLSSASLSGVDPQAFAREHPLTRDLPPEAIDAFLAAHAGFLLRLAATAGPGADRHLVAMATALGKASLRWLRRRLQDVSGT